MASKAYTLAFDVYGTLIDTAGVFSTLKQMIGSQAQAFMVSWRNKQLEYSFRRGIMQQYVDFSTCTRDALEFCGKTYRIVFSKEQTETLLEIYRKLPAFSDVEGCLEECKKNRHQIFAFSNGSHRAVSQLLDNAKLSHFFNGIVSVESTAMFKPSPIVYAHFNSVTHSNKSGSWLISGNSFDVVGAMTYGMRGIWVRRTDDNVFDVGWAQPTATVFSLTDLVSVLEDRS
jgi:2-haloacid dehalogenase